MASSLCVAKCKWETSTFSPQRHQPGVGGEWWIMIPLTSLATHTSGLLPDMLQEATAHPVPLLLPLGRRELEAQSLGDSPRRPRCCCRVPWLGHQLLLPMILLWLLCKFGESSLPTGWGSLSPGCWEQRERQENDGAWAGEMWGPAWVQNSIRNIK